VFDENGFMYYKRHTQLMSHVIKTDISLSNCHVVPYNRELCSDTMHTLILKFVVNPCLSSIFLSMLVKELIDAKRDPRKKY